jgi:hypothetical protein
MSQSRVPLDRTNLLFDSVLLVGLHLDQDTRSYKPYIKSKFPANVRFSSILFSGALMNYIGVSLRLKYLRISNTLCFPTLTIGHPKREVSTTSLTPLC